MNFQILTFYEYYDEEDEEEEEVEKYEKFQKYPNSTSFDREFEAEPESERIKFFWSLWAEIFEFKVSFKIIKHFAACEISYPINQFKLRD